MPAKVGLCGKEACAHICSRVCYCPVGLELSYRRLRARRVQRDQRAALRAVADQLEANVLRAAGPFKKFQLQLAWERQMKGETRCEGIS
jgi:hypothetical protein